MTTQSAKKEETRNNTTWNTKKINELIEQIDDGYEPKITPFWEGYTEWRAPNVVFELTEEEYEILKMCDKDVVYFANRFAHAMTDDGIQQIRLRPYQEDVMRDFADNRFNVFLSPRQSGKCVEYGTMITLKNADTGDIVDIPIGRFYYNHIVDKTIYDRILYGLNEIKLWLQGLR